MLGSEEYSDVPEEERELLKGWQERETGPKNYKCGIFGINSEAIGGPDYLVWSPKIFPGRKVWVLPAIPKKKDTEPQLPGEVTSDFNQMQETEQWTGPQSRQRTCLLVLATHMRRSLRDCPVHIREKLRAPLRTHLDSV